MCQATLCSSSGGQLYEYNFWYNHSVLVAVRYAGKDGTVVVVRYAGKDGTVVVVRYAGKDGIVVVVRYAGKDGTVVVVRYAGKDGTVVVVRYAGKDGTVVVIRYAGKDGTAKMEQFHLELRTGWLLTQSDYTRSCIHTIVLLSAIFLRKERSLNFNSFCSVNTLCLHMQTGWLTLIKDTVID